VLLSQLLSIDSSLLHSVSIGNLSNVMGACQKSGCLRLLLPLMVGREESTYARCGVREDCVLAGEMATWVVPSGDRQDK
jgi:hypothetical protein